MKQWVALVLGMSMLVPAQGAEEGEFLGRVAVEWIDDPFVPTMKLLEDFSFRQADGRMWTARKGQVLDAKGLPPLFKHLAGAPFEGGFRKSAVLYDAAAHRMDMAWDDAQRMFYEASITEGVFSADAKAMYVVLATQGSRWELKGSRCYGTCHGSTQPLEWRPVVDERKVNDLAAWARANDPELTDIDNRAKVAIKAFGPHIFTQPECDDLFSGSTRIRKHCNDRR